MTHIMVDLETFGTKPGCIIASIGAVAFDPFLGTVDKAKGIHIVVDIASAFRAGLTFDPNTVKWWMQQSTEARQALAQGIGLYEALEKFLAFWKANKGLHIWSHGASFDAPILEAALVAMDMEVPWKFWDCRDTRTAYDLAEVRLASNRTGTHHNALDDAITQADGVCLAYRKLGKAKAVPQQPAAPVVLPRPAIPEWSVKGADTLF